MRTLIALVLVGSAFACMGRDGAIIIESQADADLLPRRVTGDVLIDAQYQDIAFPNLEAIDEGTLRIRGTSSELRFDALEHVGGSIALGHEDDFIDMSIEFPALEAVEKRVTVRGARVTNRVVAPNLERIGQGLGLRAARDVRLDLERLQDVGPRGLGLARSHNIELNVPALDEVTAFDVGDVSNLKMSGLRRIGKLRFAELADFSPPVTHIDVIAMVGPQDTPITFPALQTAESIFLHSGGVAMVAPRLEAVSTLSLRGPNPMFSATDPFHLELPSLTSVETLQLDRGGGDIELRATDVGDVRVRRWLGRIELPRLTSLRLLRVIGSRAHVSLPALTQVPAARTEDPWEICGDELPNLQEFEGDLVVRQCERPIAFDALVHVAGSVNLEGGEGRFPALQEVEGDLVLNRSPIALPFRGAIRVGGNLIVRDVCAVLGNLESVAGDVEIEASACPTAQVSRIRYIGGTLRLRSRDQRMSVQFRELEALGYTCGPDGCTPVESASLACEPAIETFGSGPFFLDLRELRRVNGSISVPAPCDQVNVGNFRSRAGCAPLCDED